MEKLSFFEKSGFSVGELAGSGVWQVMLIFLPMFYTDTFGVPAAAVGTMFIVVRIFDAINDPMMGAIADRTNSRWGKFRPYLLLASLPFGLLVFLMFLGPNFSESGKLIYSYSTYITMMVIYTMAMIPFSALSGVMTSDYWDRTSLNSFRFIGAFTGALMVQGLVKPAVKYFGGGNDIIGFRWTMGIYGFACIFFFLIAFISTKERIKPVFDKRNALKDDLKDLTKNIPWIIILSVSLLTLIYISIRSSVQLYYFKYYIKKPDLVTLFMVVGTSATILAIFFTSRLTKIFDKKRLYMICMSIVGLSSLFFYYAKPTDLFLIFSVQIVFSFASGPTMPLLWSMMADTADYSEWKNGRRATGLVFSASTFAQKAGGALGGAIAMYLLAFYGYVANTAQTYETLKGMRLMLSYWPAVAAFICVLILAFYKLDAGLLKKIETELKLRKSNLGLEENIIKLKRR